MFCLFFNRKIFLFSALVIGGLWACQGAQKKKDQDHPSKKQETTIDTPPQYFHFKIDSKGFNGSFKGPEFDERGDVAHQFSNAIANEVGQFLKTSFLKKTYLKIDLAAIKISTKGLDQEDSVEYTVKMPFKRVERCAAFTGVEHCGSWNYEPKLFLNKRYKNQIDLLKKISIGNMEFEFYETPEGFQEYWIQFHHKDYQANCAGN